MLQKYTGHVEFGHKVKIHNYYNFDHINIYYIKTIKIFFSQSRIKN